MDTQAINSTEKRRSFLETIILAVFCGVLIGVFYLWVFEASLPLFFAGIAAGVVFTVAISLVIYFFGVQCGCRGIILTGVAGAIAGAAWWLVMQPTIHISLAVVIGAGLAIVIVWAETRFKPSLNEHAT